jgi:glycosyltransferase involved in cell wall biosynthesis
MDGLLSKIGLVITVKDRYEYTRQTFIDLCGSKLPVNSMLLIVDDGSEEETERLVKFFPFRDMGLNIEQIHRVRNEESKGVAKSLQSGWDYCTANGCDILCNLDNDVRLKPDWLISLLKLHVRHPEKVISGFNANNLNHVVLGEFNDYVVKSSIGGINMLFSKKIYYELRELLNDNSWDWKVSDYFKQFIVSRPSVVQHIGLTGLHSSPEDHIDMAEDF